MEVQILDEEVLSNLVSVNDGRRAQGKVANQGIRLKLTDSDDRQLFFGDVHPNVQYEYEAVDPGAYTVCIMLTDAAFFGDYSQVKTKVKFSAEFHRSK